MYVVIYSCIFGTHGTVMTHYRPQPMVYMNWFQELHDPSLPIESQWFDTSEINSVIRRIDHNTGAVFVMIHYMLSYRRGRGRGIP